MRIKFEAHFVFDRKNAFRFSQPSRFVFRDLHNETESACVILIFATLTFWCERWIEATIDAPTPNISPIPVANMKKGATIFTAAKASLPTPLPTNIPSAILIVAERIIPNKVGINIIRNNFGMFIVPKSILSCIISFFSFYFCGTKVGFSI